MVTTANLTEQIIQQESEYVVPSYKRAPFVLVRGEGVTLYDAEGNAYQDWAAGIAVNALGYSDAGLVKTLQQAATGLIHTSNLYYTPPSIQLAEALCEKSFAEKVFFSNSGAEANEGAVKFARRVAYDSGQTEKIEVVCFSDAFHGRTMGALALTPKDKYQLPFKPLMPGVIVAEYNHIASAEAAIGPQTAAVIVEPIQGEGGINAAKPEFLKALRGLCNKHGALLIFDEVQCGMGRTGDLWAHTASGVEPDMMTLAKPLAGGLPIGAILTTNTVANHIHPGDHGSTFAGGPFVTSAAAYVLERVSDPQFLAHVNEVGDYLKERLEELNSPVIKEVRGRGLMIGVEFTLDDVNPLIQAGYKHGLIMINAGPNVIRLVPPLIVDKANVDNLVEKLSAILATI